MNESWLRTNWRPITMLTLVVMTLLHWLGLTPDTLSQDSVNGVLDIVQVGLGGYVVGRSAEKVMKAYKQADQG
jgi:hypothetical protein